MNCACIPGTSNQFTIHFNLSQGFVIARYAELYGMAGVLFPNTRHMVLGYLFTTRSRHDLDELAAPEVGNRGPRPRKEER